MKKLIFITTFILFAGLTGLFAQSINPIPSFNYPITSLNSAFEEIKTHGQPNHEKRDMNVEITSSSTSPIPVFAKVWIVKNRSAVVLGPYTILPEQVLSVPIDNGTWGVVIRCDWDVEANVWVD